MIEYLGEKPSIPKLVDCLRDRGEGSPVIKTPHGEFLVSFRRLTRTEREKLGLQDVAHALHIEGMWRSKEDMMGQIVIDDQDGDGALGSGDFAQAFFESSGAYAELTEQDYYDIRESIYTALNIA